MKKLGAAGILIIKRVGIALWIIATIALICLAFKEVRANKQYYNTYSSEYLHMNSLLPLTFEERVQSGEGFIALISRPSCPDCRDIEEFTIRVIEEYDLRDKVFYVNVSSIRKSVDDPVWVNFKSTYGDIQGTPSFVLVKDGAVVSYYDGPDGDEPMTYDGLIEWLKSVEYV